MPQLLPFSVTCAACKNTHGASDENAFLFIASTRALGWVIPDALENKPIVCPACNKEKR